MFTFRPTLTQFEDRLNLSADPLPVLLVIADRQDFSKGGDKGWIEIQSSQLGNQSQDDVIVDGRIITGESWNSKSPRGMDGVVILSASLPAATKDTTVLHGPSLDEAGTGSRSKGSVHTVTFGGSLVG